MDDQHQTKKWFRERRFGKAFLYFELVYVIALFLSAWFNFGLFAHLIVGQFIIIALYYLTGAVVGIYLKKTGQLPVDEREKESLRERIAYRFNSRFFYHSLEFIDLILGVSVAIRACAQNYAEIFANINAIDLLHYLIGYIGFAYFLSILSTVISLLMNWRNGVRDGGILTIITALILFICWPAHWVNYILGIVTVVVALFIYYKNKL